MLQVVDMSERATIAIDLGESHFREFKSALEGPPGAKRPRDPKVIAEDIAETLVAFANADGGELLVGVEDQGEVTGIEHLTENQVTLLLEAPRARVHSDTPLPEARCSRIQAGAHTLLYFAVPKSATHVHLTSQGHCLQRHDLATRPVAPERILFERREQISREYDRQFVDGASTEALDRELVQAVAQQLSPGMSVERCLQYLDLAEYAGPGLRLRRAALLLFAKSPQQWHPRLQIRTLKVAGTSIGTGDSYNVASDTTLVGNVLRQIEEGWDSLRPHLVVQTRFGEGARFESTVMYPELACREALVNAIAHRDYSDEGRGIEIYVFQDRLEVRSPGGLLSTIKITDLLKLEGAHQSRNALVARVLRELGYMRELGEGVRRIFSLMQQNELTPPEFATTSTSFSVTLHHKAVYSQEEKLWLAQFESCSLDREQKAVLVLGIGGALIAPQDIWDKLGIVDTEHYRRLVVSLQDLRILKTVLSKSVAYSRANQLRVPVRRIARLQVVPPPDLRQTSTPLIALARGVSTRVSRGAQRRNREVVADAPSSSARIWLGNIPLGATRDTLLAHASKYGRVADLVLPETDGWVRGYAFVEYATASEAQEALGKLQGSVFAGSRIRARPARPR